MRVYGPKNGKADQLLAENADYTVGRPDGCTEVGRYDYAVQGKGNYVGDLTTTLEVAKETLSSVQVAPTTFNLRRRREDPVGHRCRGRKAPRAGPGLQPHIQQ